MTEPKSLIEPNFMELMPHEKTPDEAPVSYRAKHIRRFGNEIYRLSGIIEEVKKAAERPGVDAYLAYDILDIINKGDK